MLRVRMFWGYLFTDYQHAGQDIGLTQGSLIPKEHSPCKALKHSIRQHKLDLILSKTKQPLPITTNSHLNFRNLTASTNLQTQNLKIEHRHTWLNTALQLLGKKLSSSKQLVWNLNNVSHKVIENTKQANSSSLSTYFMISETKWCKSADLCSNVNMP